MCAYLCRCVYLICVHVFMYVRVYVRVIV